MVSKRLGIRLMIVVGTPLIALLLALAWLVGYGSLPAQALIVGSVPLKQSLHRRSGSRCALPRVRAAAVGVEEIIGEA